MHTKSITIQRRVFSHRKHNYTAKSFLSTKHTYKHRINIQCSKQHFHFAVSANRDQAVVLRTRKK
uniref:Uncharacterized protein n=1 Tax=Arundo donax TaxID=35708 RepID=A0A0A9G566_ARUDO